MPYFLVLRLLLALRTAAKLKLSTKPDIGITNVASYQDTFLANASSILCRASHYRCFYCIR